MLDFLKRCGVYWANYWPWWTFWLFTGAGILITAFALALLLSSHSLKSF